MSSRFSALPPGPPPPRLVRVAAARGLVARASELLRGATSAFVREVDADARLVFVTLALGALASLAIAKFVFHFSGAMGPDSGARFLMLRTWVEGGKIVFLGSAHDGAARMTDPFAGYVVHVPGGACTVYPAAFPALSAIGYRLFGDVGLVLLPSACGMVAPWASYRAARLLGLAEAKWLPLLILFGTPVLLYSSTFWDHTLLIALVALASWRVIFAFVEETPRAMWLAGGLLGAGAFFHELLLLFGICLGVSLLFGPRRFATRYWGGLALLLSSWATFNWFVYATPRGPHLLGPVDPTDPFKVSQLIDVHAVAARLSSELAGGAGTLDWCLVGLALATPVAARFSQLLAATLAAAASATSLFLLLDQPVAGGLLQVTPWLLFAFVGMGRAAPKDARSHVHAALERGAGLFLIGVVATPIAPGLNWGSRYMLTVTPILALLSLRTLRGLARAASATRAASFYAVVTTFYVVIASLGLWRGARFYATKVQFDDGHAATLAKVSTNTTATDLWWLAPEVVTHPLATKLALVVHVPASEQLAPLPPPAARDVAVRAAFFAAVDAAHETELTFVGSEHGRAAFAPSAQTAGFHELGHHTEADLVVATFSCAPADPP